jgi:hypothetical protein
MIRNVHPLFKKVVLAAALLSGVWGISGVARADNSSMNPLGGGSYAYDGGYNPAYNGNQALSAWRLSHPDGLSERMLERDSSSAPAWQRHEPIFNQAPSAWRLSHPDGLSERMLERDSSSAPAWRLHQPMFASTSAAAEFRQTQPNGLTERQFQALSSEVPAWQLRSGATTTSVASIEQGTIGQGAAS